MKDHRCPLAPVAPMLVATARYFFVKPLLITALSLLCPSLEHCMSAVASPHAATGNPTAC